MRKAPIYFLFPTLDRRSPEDQTTQGPIFYARREPSVKNTPPYLTIGLLGFSVTADDELIYTGVDLMVRSGFREYEEEKLRSPACCRPENAIFTSYSRNPERT